MKSLIKTFLLNNMLEVSTWIGIFILVREFLSYDSSNVMIVIGLLLTFVPDSAIRNFVAQKAAPLRDAIAKW